MKKNIIYIGNFDLDSDNAALSRVKSNLILLDDQDINKNIIGFSEKDRTYNINGVNYFASPKPRSIIQLIKYFTSFDKIEAAISDDSENLIIMYNLPSLLSFLILAKYKSRNAVISDITEWYSVEGKSFLKRYLYGFDIKFRMKYVNMKTDGLIVISKFLSEYYHSVFHVVIPPLAGKEVLDFVNNEVKKSNESIVKYVYAGFPGVDKDRLDLIIESFAYIKNNNLSEKHYELHIYGVEINQFIRLFPNYVHFLELLKENVYFHGYKSRDYILNELKDADFSFIIRDNNQRNKSGFPTKFSELQTLGIPIIYTNFSNISEYTDERKDIQVSEMTSVFLTEAILSSLEVGFKRIPSQELSTENNVYKQKLSKFISEIINKKKESDSRG